MGRRRLPMEVIPNQASRRRTFNVRKDSLMKKCYELETLCGVQTCLIVYGPEDTEPLTYPREPERMNEILGRYRREVTTENLRKKVSGLPEFFMSRKRKFESELTKAQEANLKAKFPVSDSDLSNFSREELISLKETLDLKIDAMTKRHVAMKTTNSKRDVQDSHGIGTGRAVGMEMGVGLNWMDLMETQLAPDNDSHLPLMMMDDNAWSRSNTNDVSYTSTTSPVQSIITDSDYIDSLSPWLGTELVYQSEALEYIA